MQVKINKEIKDYSEAVFFGLSFRQLIFSVTAVIVAVIIYLSLKPYLGTETVSWLCVLAAAPFAALGFVRYHGMNAEKLLWVIIRDCVVEQKRLRIKQNNIYRELLKGVKDDDEETESD